MNGQSEISFKTFTISIETPDGALAPAQVQIPDLPLGLADIVPPLHRLADGLVHLANGRETRAGRPVRCDKGCGACCNQLVPLAIPEILFMAGVIEELPGPRKCGINAAFAEINRRLTENGLLDRFETLERDKDDLPVARDYFFTGLPCPFLIDQSCSIHAWRPLACREYNVTSDPAFCANPFTNKISRVKVHRKMTTACAKLAAGLLDLSPFLVPMPLLFVWFEKNKNLADLRWNGIELFEVTLRCALGK